MHEEHADVVVVGAGPSGSVITHTLATAGLRVVCLEQGDWVGPSDYPGQNREWELQIQNQWAHDPNVRRLPADYPVDVEHSDMWPVMFNGVGGSSIYFGAQWPRLVPSDFRVKTLDGIADDWPITYQDLAPYYDRIDQFVGAAGLGGDPAYPDGLDYPLPPHPLGPVGRKAAEAANKLGWHWWPGPNAIPTHKFKELAQCARWGVCEWGCPEGSKASFDISYWPHALKSGAQLVTGARVRAVETRPDGRASGVLWVDRAGVEHRQTANAVVLCSNGIGTARILLMSSPEGLANSSGLVGKNLMLHPNAAVTGYFDSNLKSWQGPIGQPVQSMEFYETKDDRDFVRGIKLSALPTPGPLAAVDAHRDRGYEDVWGDAFLDVARTHASGVMWAAITEDLPEETNQVTLHPTMTDDSGLPAPSLRYRISDNTRAQLEFACERMLELQTAAGATDTITVPLWIDQPGHLLGTARMGSDPATSVTSSFGQTHDIDNLFIADGSLFVTGGAVNPTSTIAALALRVADGILDTRRERKDLA